MHNLERRYLPAELRADASNPRRLTGYAVVWGARSGDLGGFVETFAVGAFADHLKDGADVRALVNHDTAKVIGRQSAGTLTIQEDSYGLRFQIDVAETSYGDDILASVKRGDVTGMSFGFSVVEDAFSAEDNGVLRTVRTAKLYEVSPVTFPAYEASSVLNRSSDLCRERAKAAQPFSEMRRILLRLKKYELTTKENEPPLSK